MTEGPKKASRKFKFFKFKGFGSLSNLPRSFTLRRPSAPISVQSQLEPDTFEATQDDMVTVPKSPPAYARSSDMYSHMGTMPRPNTKKARDRARDQAQEQARKGSPEPHLVLRGLPDPPGLEAAKEVVVKANSPLKNTPAAGPGPSAVEMDPTRKPEDPVADTEEQVAPRDAHSERATGEPAAGEDYVKVLGPADGIEVTALNSTWLIVWFESQT